MSNLQDQERALVRKLVTRCSDLEDAVVALHERQVEAGVIDPALTRAINRAARAMTDVSIAACQAYSDRNP